MTQDFSTTLSLFELIFRMDYFLKTNITGIPATFLYTYLGVYFLTKFKFKLFFAQANSHLVAQYKHLNFHSRSTLTIYNRSYLGLLTTTTFFLLCTPLPSLIKNAQCLQTYLYLHHYGAKTVTHSYRING